MNFNEQKARVNHKSTLAFLFNKTYFQFYLCKVAIHRFTIKVRNLIPYICQEFKKPRLK